MDACCCLPLSVARKVIKLRFPFFIKIYKNIAPRITTTIHPLLVVVGVHLIHNIPYILQILPRTCYSSVLYFVPFFFWGGCWIWSGTGQQQGRFHFRKNVEAGISFVLRFPCWEFILLQPSLFLRRLLECLNGVLTHWGAIILQTKSK